MLREEIKYKIEELKLEISSEKNQEKKMALFMTYAERRDHIIREIQERILPF